MRKIFLASSISCVASEIAKQINQKGLKLAFISTASEAEEGDLKWLEDDKRILENAGFGVTEYTITDKSKEEIEKDLENFDVIFISGGNTFYLLEKIQQSNCANVIKNLVDNGKIYIGSSAGSVVAGADIYPIKDFDNIRKAPDIKGYEGLGFVNFVIFPHWGNELFKKKYLSQRLKDAYNANNQLLLLTDNCYIYVDNDCLRIIDITKNDV